jgi:Fe-S-cluster containining protein
MSTEALPSALPTTWWAGGLRFACLTGCRRCCRGEPGVVYVSEEEVTALSACLDRPRGRFEAECVRRISWKRRSLRERPDGDCVLLGEQGCRAYAARPRQCRSYPFWPEVLASPETWESEGRRCPGIGQGRLYDAAEIRNWVAGVRD